VERLPASPVGGSPSSAREDRPGIAGRQVAGVPGAAAHRAESRAGIPESGTSPTVDPIAGDVARVAAPVPTSGTSTRRRATTRHTVATRAHPFGMPGKGNPRRPITVVRRGRACRRPPRHSWPGPCTGALTMDRPSHRRWRSPRGAPENAPRGRRSAECLGPGPANPPTRPTGRGSLRSWAVPATTSAGTGPRPPRGPGPRSRGRARPLPTAQPLPTEMSWTRPGEESEDTARKGGSSLGRRPSPLPE